MRKFDPALYHRRSVRLPGYDYARPGAYFVTICACGRECLFGEALDGRVVLNDAGRIAAEAWTWLEERYGHVRLDKWIVMPNHMHGIIMIIDPVHRRGGSRTAPKNAAGRKPLGRLIGAYKTVSTKRINEARGTPGVRVWQRNYYEHVIRDDDELVRIREYIVNNPARWDLDRENPKNVT